MPVARIRKDTPTIREILLYTFKVLKSRFIYSKRDILRSKVRVTKKIVYSKVGMETQFTSRLEIRSFSNPMYSPYTSLPSGNRKNAPLKDRVTHEYPVVIQLAPDSKGKFSIYSKIRWRIGSFKKWNPKPPQREVKCIYPETREDIRKRIESKYRKETQEVQKKKMKEELQKIKDKGKYLDIGDYNSRELGLNGDNYFRNQSVQYIYNCLYGPYWRDDLPSEISYPFFCKHAIYIIFYLLRIGVLKKR